jgi:DNA-3-methyladenine glycosylase II
VHRLAIRPVPPYDFDLSARIFSGGDPQFRDYAEGEFRQALRVDGRIALLSIKSKGTVDEAALRVAVVSDDRLSRGELEKVRALVVHMLNLDMDLKPFYRAVSGDPVMSRLTRSLYGLKSPTTPTVFEALVDSIIEQQISLASAHSMQRRLIRRYGDTADIGGATWYLYPTPAALGRATLRGLQDCGLSRRKSEYIRDVSAQVDDGRLDLDAFESFQDTGEILEELKRVRGIGDWTAEMVMIRGLHKMDSLPADDIGLQARVSYFYGQQGRASADDLRRVAGNWGRYRGLGGYYMIVAHNLGLEAAVPGAGADARPQSREVPGSR